ncbi:unnamed protein product, partial [Ectocarpus sp. 6 AP-2014]
CDREAVSEGAQRRCRRRLPERRHCRRGRPEGRISDHLFKKGNATTFSKKTSDHVFCVPKREVVCWGPRGNTSVPSRARTGSPLFAPCRSGLHSKAANRRQNHKREYPRLLGTSNKTSARDHAEVELCG